MGDRARPDDGAPRANGGWLIVMVAEAVSSAMDRERLRERLAGTRGFLLDLDGVLVLRGEPIAGAAESLARLDERRVPYLVLTNTSIVSRATLSADIAHAGIRVPPERIVSAVSGTADYTRRRFRDRRLYVLTSADGVREFGGQRLVGHEEAAAAARAGNGGHDPIAAVIVGDAGEEFTLANLQTAFRLVRAGARFVAMHRNRWWYTPDGETLDAGPFVVALEYATQTKATLVGKPSAAFFRVALRRLRELAGSDGDLAAAEVMMAGDDVWADVLAAQRVGMRGGLVLTGRHGAPELARAAAARSRRLPDVVAESLSAIVAALD